MPPLLVKQVFMTLLSGAGRSIAPFILCVSLFSSCSVQKTATFNPDNVKVYPAPPDTARIQYLTSISSSDNIIGKQGGFNRFLFGEAEPIGIIKPYGISCQGASIYICDTGIGGLIIINLADGSFRQFRPTGKGQLQFPVNCTADSDGTLFIADGNRRQVVVFDTDGNYINAFGEADEGFKPTGVTISGDRILVASISNHLVYSYNKSDYSLISKFPEFSPGENGYLYQPANISSEGGYTYVSDIGDYSIKVFNHDGAFIRSIGSYGNSYGQFMRPKGVAVDNENNTYVVDAAFENVQVFNSDGRLLMFFGGPYKSPGDMWLPADIAIDYNNLEYFSQFVDPDFELQYLIYVTNQYGPDKIGVYGFVKMK